MKFPCSPSSLVLLNHKWVLNFITCLFWICWRLCKILWFNLLTWAGPSVAHMARLCEWEKGVPSPRWTQLHASKAWTEFQPHSTLQQDAHLLVTPCEEPDSRPKSYVWSFRPEHRQLQRLCLAALKGKAALHTGYLVHSLCIAVSRELPSNTPCAPPLAMSYTYRQFLHF